MKLSQALGAVALIGAASGCWNHKYTVGSGGNTEAPPTYGGWQSHWFFGSIGETEVDIATVCPSGNATIVDEVSFLNGLVGLFTGIVWYPSEVEVYCDGPEASVPRAMVRTIVLSPQRLRAIAMQPETLEWARGISLRQAAELEEAIRLYRLRTKNMSRHTGTAAF